MNEIQTKIPPATELIGADEARALAEAAQPGRAQAEADTLAANALRWAMHNAEGQTSTRIRTYAKYGRRSLMLKFAPGEDDCAGEGNAFYNDLLANSNVLVADAISSIIHGRPQALISPLQEMRLLNEYNAKLDLGEGVFVRGKASQRESWRQLEQALRAAQAPRSGQEDEVDDDAPPLFSEVKPSDSSQNRDGMFPFTVEAKFPVSKDEDSSGRKAK